MIVITAKEVCDKNHVLNLEKHGFINFQLFLNTTLPFAKHALNMSVTTYYLHIVNFQKNESCN